MRKRGETDKKQGSVHVCTNIQSQVWGFPHHMHVHLTRRLMISRLNRLDVLFFSPEQGA